MHQKFTAATRPQDGPPRLAALRRMLQAEGLVGFMVPRADPHQSEYVTPHDARLAWLTGFTGSAGFAIVLRDSAGVFIDGRYRMQVRVEVDLGAFTPVHWPETKPATWLAEHLPSGGKLGYDPWLHSQKEIEDLETQLEGTGITLWPCKNLIDAIWADQPAPPVAAARAYPLHLAGESSGEKRARLSAVLSGAGQTAVVLTLSDSISWLLNIRGSDIPRNPVVQAFAILQASGRLTLFAAPEKFDAQTREHFGPDVTLRPFAAFAPAVRGLIGPVRVDPASAPRQIVLELNEAGVQTVFAADPCLLPKACKNPTEITGMINAHRRDGAAMVEFLTWLDVEAPKGSLSEIDVVRRLEAFREATGALREISFDTICGAGPNGAIVHYRVTEASNRKVVPGEILLVDSGGQYLDGTTDITRTIAVGTVPEAVRAPFTRVLQGLIALSRARWPKGLAGRDLDPIARYPSWLAGQDYDHGTGHGVGAYLSVHEGPARLARISDVPLEPGMILSIEPGYYREGAFGIRLENLAVVREAGALPDADAHRTMLCFETITLAPIDTRLLDLGLLSYEERAWLNAYHARVLEALHPLVSAPAQAWLARATAPI